MEQGSSATLIRLALVLSLTGLKRTQCYELVKQKRFPRAIRISDRCVAWVREEVDEWIRERIAASRRGEGL